MQLDKIYKYTDIECGIHCFVNKKCVSIFFLINRVILDWNENKSFLHKETKKKHTFIVLNLDESNEYVFRPIVSVWNKTWILLLDNKTCSEMGAQSSFKGRKFSVSIVRAGDERFPRGKIAWWKRPNVHVTPAL